MAKSKNTHANDMSTRFALYDFAGREKAFYQVDRVIPTSEGDEKKLKKSVSHHIVIIDRSGSMYSSMGPLKEMLIKLLTIDEYHNDQMKVSLLSYSSKGDCVVHFERVSVEEVMSSRSSYQKEIQKIRVTGLTCISQSLKKAQELLHEDELTAITLHSDGYANHPNLRHETAEVEKTCKELQKQNVFVNTIAYTSWSDFKFLSKIANSVSGSCIKALKVKEVYDLMHQTTEKLSEMAGPVYEEPLGNKHSYQVFLSQSAAKVNGASEDLRICGVDVSDDKTIFKYKPQDRDSFYASDLPIAQTDPSVFAFAKAMLAEGQLNTAKFALLSTFDHTLSKRHMKAMTNDDIAAFSADLSTILFRPEVLKEHKVGTEVEVSRKLSVLDVMSILTDYRKGFQVDLDHLYKNYTRRGLKRVAGTRDENGNLQKPHLTTEIIDKNPLVSVSSFDINRNTATINMLISRKVRLLKTEDKTPVEEVAGVSLKNLSNFNNYTIVGDGELTVERLRIKVSDETLFDLLEGNDLLLDENGKPAIDFDKNSFYLLELSDLPLVPFTGTFSNLDGVFETMAALKTVTSIIAAHLKDESDVYTPEQVAALRKHYLSKNLYLNFPTTTEYTDLDEALSKGTVDTRVSYKIDIGNTQILSAKNLHSANKFLERFFELYDISSGEKLKEKPKFELLLDAAKGVRPKKLSARTKITEIDNFQRPYFDDFLQNRFEKDTSIGKILHKADVTDLVTLGNKKAKGNKVEKKEWIAALTDSQRKLNQYTEKLYREKVAPLVFYIGATGLLPDEFDAKAETSDAISTRFSTLKIGKAEQEGTFFQLGNNILSVYAKNEYFSRDQTVN